MSADVVDSGESRLANGWSRSQTFQPPAKFFRLSQLRRLRGCEQVAAVCYRVRRSGIEFLLVRTNSGHWTFPKGGAEPRLTHAQAAALEAFEEAGVHGRIEEASFARYIRRKRVGNSAARSAKKELAVQAHLCEVLRLDPPQERNRNPTWFSAEKAKRRLSEDRTPDYGAELARVVDRAVTRIQRLRSGTSTATDGPQNDALKKVQFIDSVRRTTGRAKALGTG
jgi:8-oxo-dGTP pyrophosphatase MutT (NUDIX family)